MEKTIKEFKVTCKACGNTRYVPYFDFTQQSPSQQAKGCCGDFFTSIGLSLACLPLGCCSSAASLGGAEARNRTPEQQKEVYFNLQKVSVCNKCKSSAKHVEIITHIIND